MITKLPVKTAKKLIDKKELVIGDKLLIPLTNFQVEVPVRVMWGIFMDSSCGKTCAFEYEFSPYGNILNSDENGMLDVFEIETHHITGVKFERKREV